MKKLMLGIAAISAGVCFADVTSANIVGYSTSKALEPSSLTAFTTSFEDVAGGEMAVKDLVKVEVDATAVAFGASADQIWRWDTTAAAWIQYYNRKPGGRVSTGDTGWCKSGEDTLTTDKIGAGETFFFRRGSSGVACTVTFSGAVKPFSANRTYTMAASQLVFMGYPWPVEMPVVDMTKYQGDVTATAVAFGASADQIWRWDTAASAWIQYYNRKPGGRVSTGDTGWCKSGEETLTTDKVAAGEGFFYRCGSSATAGETITFTNAAE